VRDDEEEEEEEEEEIEAAHNEAGEIRRWANTTTGRW
jgi:hypothetical protein